MRLLNPSAHVPGPEPFTHLWVNKFDSGILTFVVLYGAILTVSYVLDSRERLALQQTETARLNEMLSKAQLDALRRQIEPHFLFNTLNAIAGLVREKQKDAAVDMIAGLSDFLRRVLRDDYQPARGAAGRRDGVRAKVSGHPEGTLCGTASS